MTSVSQNERDAVPAQPENVQAGHESLVIHAGKVILHEEQEEPAPEVIRRYQINALLAALLVGIACFWYYRYARTWFSQAVIVGLPALWAGWELFRAAVLKDLGDNIKKTRKKLLARRDVTERLIFLSACAFLCVLFTSTITISLGEGPVTAATVSVVDANGHAIMDDVELSTSDRVSAKLYLPRFAWQKIRVIAKAPHRYGPVKEEELWLHPMAAVDVDFSKYFEKKKLYAMRIVPNHVLKDALENYRDGELTVTVKDGPSIPLPYRYRSICIGVGDREELVNLFAAHNDQAFQDEVEQQLMNANVSADHATEIAGKLRQPMYLVTRPLASGDAVHLKLEATGLEPIVTTFYVSDREMTTKELTGKALPVEDEDQDDAVPEG